MFKRTDPSLGKPKTITSSYGYEDAMRHGYLTEKSSGFIGVKLLAVRLNVQSPGIHTKAEVAARPPMLAARWPKREAMPLLQRCKFEQSCAATPRS